MYISITILAYTLNWQLPWGKEKYLLNGFYEIFF